MRKLQIDVLGFGDERVQLLVGRVERLSVDQADFIEHSRQSLAQSFDLTAPRGECPFLAIANRLCRGCGVIAQHADAGAQVDQRGVFVLAMRLRELIHFIAQCRRPRPDMSKRIDLAPVEFGPEGFAVTAERQEAIGGRSFDLIESRAEFVERGVDPLAQRTHLSLARLAKRVEAGKTGNQFVELGSGRTPRVTDLVGDIARRSGDHGQIVAQSLHVLPGGGADAGDRVDLRAVVLHQFLQATRMFRNSLAGRTAEKFQLAALSGEEVAREAELAIDPEQPFFKAFGFQREHTRCVPETMRFARGGAHGQ